jgi:ADP-ribosyl-[dinitrogen reductase] hydrolase
MDEGNRFRGCLLGLATGDALGTTVEFKSRGSFAPLTTIVGGGPFQLQPGQWTDDTSMALCLAVSLVDCHGFDPTDQMNRYLRWYEDGYLSSTGYRFDIGNTVKRALIEFKATGLPYSGSSDPLSAGNGSLMRLAPIPMYYHANSELAVHFAAESSRTTHAAAECLDACRLFADILVRALHGSDKESTLSSTNSSFLESPSIRAIAAGSYRDAQARTIRGTGYVVRSSKLRSGPSFTATFPDAVLSAANLGTTRTLRRRCAARLRGLTTATRASPPSGLIFWQ